MAIFPDILKVKVKKYLSELMALLHFNTSLLVCNPNYV